MTGVSNTPIKRLLAAPGLWLCNLGYHKPRKGGSMSGHTKTIGNTTLSYLDCQRCGRTYPGSLMVRDWRRFP